MTPESSRRSFSWFWLPFLAVVVPLFIFGQNLKSAYDPNLFSAVRNLPESARVAHARLMYKNNCRKLPEELAMRSLNDLAGIASGQNDLPLECAVYDMRSDYYSVNRGYNVKSNFYLDEAIRFAEKHDLPLEYAIYMHRKAVYLSIYKHNIEACKYFLFAQAKFKEIGYSKVPNISAYFADLASFYYQIEDYKNARENLKLALDHQETANRAKVALLNTIGLTYRNTCEFDKAMPYLNAAVTMARQIKDSVWVGIATGNIGSIYFLEHDYKRALPLIETDYRVSLQYNQYVNASMALLRLIKINIEAHQYDVAAGQLNEVDRLLKLAPGDVLQQTADYYNLRSQLSGRVGDKAKAKDDREQYVLLRDSLEHRDNLAAIEEVRLQWELDRSKEQLNKLSTYAEIGKFKRNSLIIVLALLVVIVLLVYNRQRFKLAKNAELALAEKRRLDEELQNARRTLHDYTENLTQKNQLIEEFRSEAERLRLQTDNQEGARELDKMMQAHIMTDDNWNEFKRLFSKVHPAFLFNIRNAYQHLTHTDVRLLALLKLNLNNREIAGMLGITTDGVKKAKQRLRKKMGLETGQEIEDAIINL